MPVARVQRSVGTAALPGARRTAAETATSTGAGAALAKANLGNAIAGAGAQAAEFGIEATTRLMKEARQRADETAQLAIDNKLDQFELSELYDPENGALAKKGQDSFTTPEDVDGKFAKYVGEMESSLGTEEQRAYLAKASSRRRANMQLSVRRHVAGEMERYEAGELKATLDNTVNLAAKHALDPRLAGEDIQRGVDAITAAAKRNGLGVEAIKASVEAFRSDAHVAVISNLLAQGQTKAAEIVFEEAKKADILGAKAAEVEKVIRHTKVDTEGEKAANDIWLKLGPRNDIDAISLDTMENAARERFGDDTEMVKSTIAALRFRKQGVDAGRRERESARSADVWGAVLQGQSYDAIRHMPSFIDSPDVQLKVRDYLQRQAEHAESLAATRESRANAREQREYTATMRRERQLEQQGWSAYWEMADPAHLRTLSRGEIMAQLPNLGPAHVQRLLNDHEQLTRNDAMVRAATIDNDLFKEVANEAGLTYVYENPSKVTKEERATLGRLRATVEDGIASSQQKTNRQLTFDEKRQVMKDVVARTVMVDKSFRYDVASIAAVVNPEDRARAYVPMAEIPMQNQKEAANFLRSINPAYARLSDTAILAQASRAVERAYAAKQLGLGAEEEKRRLLGGQ